MLLASLPKEVKYEFIMIKEMVGHFKVHLNRGTTNSLYRSEGRVNFSHTSISTSSSSKLGPTTCIFLLKALLCINASFHRYQICLSVKLLTATILRMLRMYKLIVIHYLFHQAYIEPSL